MSTPSDRRFTESHEWFQHEGDVVTVGITQYAANELTDVTFVEMKPTGTAVSVGDSLGEVESVKTTSDIYAAVAGEIPEPLNFAATAIRYLAPILPPKPVHELRRKFVPSYTFNFETHEKDVFRQSAVNDRVRAWKRCMAPSE